MPETSAPVTAAPLAGFGEATRSWFEAVYPGPTPAQLGAWEAIGRGDDTLVIAPTGSGKTLSAFLSALDRLTRRPRPEGAGTRVLYVSPLKALATDVERNLRAPLRGITNAAEAAGAPVAEVTVGVRSGDTSASERRRLAQHPPDILITTPESLFLVLTSQARETLGSVETIIVDEVHALAGTKRGAHLALSLERLAALTEERPQRIGLSATVRPAERVAAFLTGARPATIVRPPSIKTWDLAIEMPDPGTVEAPAEPTDGAESATNSVWPAVHARVLDLVLAATSTIVFCNSRRVAERLTAALNALHAERLGLTDDTSDSPDPPADAIIARAHHGSVSHSQRADVEQALKSGLLPCVVATSSLELGIDMGAVDQVIQIGSPPSVASGLQRVGRAGHNVGDVSRGIVLPLHRSDLVEAAVTVQRMQDGLIEEVPALTNPLDVLAQQIVAITAMDPIGVDDLLALARGAEPFATLSRALLESVLDMLTGRYPSEEFRELRPRLVWDRTTDSLTARPGSQRLAVTSGGTIPDRGLFGVFLVGEASEGQRSASRRVGELDEEMVHESRVGDVFALGTTSWRIEEITHDQVLVTPAPGASGKLPFWHGDAPSRPAELGVAIGAFQRELATGGEAVRSVLDEVGLDEHAREELTAYVNEQVESTGVVPSDRTILLERFRDELGDWRLCLHAPHGRAVLEPWAMAIRARATEQLGLEVQAHATNDGIVVQVADTDGQPPGLDLVMIDDVEELEELITREVGSSALFAARFREAAARALLLPRRNPRQRTPLWQQRMRASQLLQVAARHPEFPIMLETVRECLRDVFDLAALSELHRAIGRRELRVVEVETPTPSPFARSLMFGFVGEFLYSGDLPLAERRSVALSLDLGLLTELLGKDALSDVLDPEVVAEVERQLQALSDDRRVGSVERVVDLVRSIGPLTSDEIAARTEDGADASALVAEAVASRRLAEVVVNGRPMLAVGEDLGMLAEGLGVPAPPGWGLTDVPEEPARTLVLRWAASHGPFTAEDVAARWGLPVSVTGRWARELATSGHLVEARFLAETDGHATQFCSTSVLARIRRRMLAALREGIEPVPPPAYARFLLDWQSVLRPHRGVDGLLAALEQLAGCPLPASQVERSVLPLRVRDYDPAMLDELLSAGEVAWHGVGASGENDGWVAFTFDALSAPAAHGDLELPGADHLEKQLDRGGGWFFEELVGSLTTADDAPSLSRQAWADALWELVWTGRARTDTFAALRSRLAATSRPRSGSRTGGRGARPRPGRIGTSAARGTRTRLPAPPGTIGRWSAVRGEPVTDATFTTSVLVQLERYGVLTRGAVVAEDTAGGFGPTYRALSSLEELGQCRRGYFVEGLGAAQFALPGAVDRLRTLGPEEPTGDSEGLDLPDLDGAAGWRPRSTGRERRRDERPRAVVLAATDPANPYGASLDWPEREGHRPGRKIGASVVLVDGELVLYLERGGRSVLTFPASFGADRLTAAVAALSQTAETWGAARIERIDGESSLRDGPLRAALEEAGWAMTPQGWRYRAA